MPPCPASELNDAGVRNQGESPFRPVQPANPTVLDPSIEAIPGFLRACA